MSESAQSSADSSAILIPSQELDYRDYHTTQSYERFSQQLVESDDQVDRINETPPAEVSARMSKEEVSDFLKNNGIPEQYCKVFEGTVLASYISTLLYIPRVYS